MDIFQGWQDHEKKIKNNWENTVSESDTVVLVGDFCWAKNFEEALPSFDFVEKLPGKKILLKGNHDYWWSTKSKMENFFASNNLTSFNILHNNHYVVENVCICGTKGWPLENNTLENNEDSNVNHKLINRETERLRFSVTSCLHLNLPILAFIHYPPIYKQQTCDGILDILKQYKIQKCYYGHIHGNAKQYSVNTIVDDVAYQLVSCDHINFSPLKIK